MIVAAIPGASARFAPRDPDVAMIASLVAKGWRYLPDLMLPQPSTASTGRGCGTGSRPT